MEEMTIAMMLKKVNDELYKKANAELQKNNLTFSQMHVLIYLSRSEKNDVPLKELEKKFQVAQATMAGIVQRLEAKKFIASRTDPADKRVKLVHLTAKGRRYMNENRLEMEQNDASLVRNLSEADQKELMRLLKVLYRTVREGETVE
jgi:DNA-binding MarR family transcriptional regulator